MSVASILYHFMQFWSKVFFHWPVSLRPSVPHPFLCIFNCLNLFSPVFPHFHSYSLIFTHIHQMSCNVMFFTCFYPIYTCFLLIIIRFHLFLLICIGICTHWDISVSRIPNFLLVDIEVSECIQLGIFSLSCLITWYPN